ncbi:hypothetical protein ABKN59_002125 [Abortiporus biennis]
MYSPLVSYDWIKVFGRVFVRSKYPLDAKVVQLPSQLDPISLHLVHWIGKIRPTSQGVHSHHSSRYRGLYMLNEHYLGSF